MRVLDDQGQPVPAGKAGEICARAPYVMDCYHGLPEATVRTLAGGWLHTGDIGFIDGDGYVHRRRPGRRRRSPASGLG